MREPAQSTSSKPLKGWCKGANDGPEFVGATGVLDVEFDARAPWAELDACSFFAVVLRFALASLRLRFSS
jgi:hypothetical protein